MALGWRPGWRARALRPAYEKAVLHVSALPGRCASVAELWLFSTRPMSEPLVLTLHVPGDWYVVAPQPRHVEYIKTPSCKPARVAVSLRQRVTINKKGLCCNAIKMQSYPNFANMTRPNSSALLHLPTEEPSRTLAASTTMITSAAAITATTPLHHCIGHRQRRCQQEQQQGQRAQPQR